MTKKFGDFTAVNNVSFSIEAGKIYGILGPNGAGKTTMISLILGIEKPTSGRILVDGLDNIKHKSEVKQLIGFMTQETIVDSDLTAYENLEIGAKLYHISQGEAKAAIERALEESELTEFKDKPAGTFSGGMKRRLYLVKSMLHDPKVLILDEPTTGLDVHNRVGMWKHIRELNGNGVTIILTTQYLEEAEELCNEISVMDHGKIIASGTPSELKRMVSKGQVVEIITNKESAQKIMRVLQHEFKLSPMVKDDKIEAYLESNSVALFARILGRLIKEKLPLVSISMHLPTMDDVFIKLTGSSLRDSIGENKSDRDRIMLQRH